MTDDEGMLTDGERCRFTVTDDEGVLTDGDRGFAVTDDEVSTVNDGELCSVLVGVFVLCTGELCGVRIPVGTSSGCVRSRRNRHIPSILFTRIIQVGLLLF